MSDFELYGVRAEYIDDSPARQPFRCPRCQRVRWVAHNQLGCRTGHPDTLMHLLLEGEPAESPDIEVFVP
jgi:hypothetical protein